MGALVAEVVVRILGTSQKPFYLYVLGLGSVAFGSALVLCNFFPHLTFSVMTVPSGMTDLVMGLSTGLALSACYGRLRAAILA